MENQQAKKYIKIFGRIISWIFLISVLCRIFLRDYYAREDHDSVFLILFCLGIVYLILLFKFDKERFIEEVKPRVSQIKKYWPELLVFVLMGVFIFFYNRNLN
ncbi:hypothetical protein BIW12_07495 [Flavobacterium commune]|uniref:Uncharacterized protein n=1 Tax=Flavobacterium commune TaxID=1306519 RepID=A0A1D9P9N8_9FLAO|nr:hypothetical protein BIW12_07495 [Flavobacterium commune]